MIWVLRSKIPSARLGRLESQSGSGLFPTSFQREVDELTRAGDLTYRVRDWLIDIRFSNPDSQLRDSAGFSPGFAAGWLLNEIELYREKGHLGGNSAIAGN
jgi:hypothetical protein